MRKRVTLVIVAIGLISLNGMMGYAADEDLIPPEILKQMDTDIRAGKRPTIATVRQSDIFGLRDQPRFEADFVRFDFDLQKVSSVQREILRAWLEAGYRPLLVRGQQISKYASLLAPAVSVTSADADNRDRSKVSSTDPSDTTSFNGLLTRHKVNTGCKQVGFRAGRSRWYGTTSSRSYQYFPFGLSELPPDAQVVAEYTKGEALAGSFSIGKGTVVFLSDLGEAPDNRRWLLNFWHWALGFPVPQAAETGVAGVSLSPVQASTYDTITLKNGDTLTGKIKNEQFTIKTSYADLTFQRDKIDKMDFEGAGANVDTLILRVGDKMSGTLLSETITITLHGGQDSEIAKDKIKTIRMRKATVKKE